MLVVVATENEVKLAEELGFKGNPILITGVGAINTIRALANVSKDTEILNIGYCGSNNITIGTLCKIGKVAMYHPSVEYGEDPIYLSNGSVICYTSSDFVKETIIDQPCVFDMELAFIASMGFKRLHSIKVVSDNLNYKEYEKNVEGKCNQ